MQKQTLLACMKRYIAAVAITPSAVWNQAPKGTKGLKASSNRVSREYPPEATSDAEPIEISRMVGPSDAIPDGAVSEVRGTKALGNRSEGDQHFHDNGFVESVHVRRI
jgi:hypothetical protein